jgi:hypothetical protein
MAEFWLFLCNLGGEEAENLAIFRFFIGFRKCY